MDYLFAVGFLGAAIAGIFALMQAKKVMAYSEGTEKMQKIAKSIREGADAYLKAAVYYCLQGVCCCICCFADYGICN